MKIKGLRWMATFLAACMLMGAVPATAFAAKETTEAAETIPQVYRMDDDNDTVRLVIGKTPTLYIGKNGTVSVTLMNMEDKDWIETEIWIASEDDFRNHYSDEITKTEDRDSEESSIVQSMKTIYPFEVTDSLNRHYKVGHVNKKAKKTVNLNVNVKKGLEEGYYPILIYISKRAQGEDGMSSEYAKTIMAWIETKKTTGTSETNEDNSEPVAFALGENQPTPSANYSEVMNFDVNVRNTGYKTAYDVRVDMELSEDITKFPFEINDGNYDRQMGNMNPDQTVAVPFSMAVREKAKSGYYPIKFKIRYRENENGNFAAPVEDTFYVRVYGKDEDDSLDSEAGENERTKARIIVDSFETDPAEIYAGQDFTLKVRMKNASNSIVASNILFTFESETVSDSPVFTTVNGSNSVVVNSLAPGASDTLTIKFSSSPTAEQRSYTITINEQYDSPEFKNAEESIIVDIPVKQYARLSTSNMDVMPDSMTVGSESNVMFGINNTGKVVLYNVTVNFEADSIKPTDYYVGNIKPGETGNVDTMLSGIAATADDGTVHVIINYEDENGQPAEPVEKELTLLVEEEVQEDWNMDVPEDMDVSGQPASGANNKLLLAGGGVAFVAVIAAIVFAVKFIKKRKEAKQQKDDENEIS